MVSLAAKYISPALFWIPAFFGLAFPFLFLLNLLFVFYWAIQLQPVIIFGILALFLSLPTAARYLQWSFPVDKSEHRFFKITSYNSMLFDLYNWKKNYESRDKTLTELNEINPDILCVQEFYTSEDKGDFNNLDTLKQLLNTRYVHHEYTITLRKNDHWGMATFSKFPIINQGKIVFHTRSNNLCIFTDLVIGNDTVRVYNLHLQSISFSKDDNKFLDEMIGDEDAKDEMLHSKNILRRLKRAFLKRSAQVEMVLLHMSTCRYKIILAGDFNDTAASYVYQRLSANLKDAFIERGNGFGRTYAGKWPQFRIDYILHDKKLQCLDYQRSEETFTDHHPITALFKRSH